MSKQIHSLFVLVLLALLLTQCAPPAPSPQPATGAQPPQAEAQPTVPAKTYKLAALFPGVITDADYNTLGYIGVTEVGKKLGIETAYSERVAVPDVERAMREYIADGYNIIFT
ncbi:MAG: hypothetical protein NZ528_06445, partial [Caldilineales bacterium]|nr:hypothetical protein [Caldilineales bacterium]